MAERYDIFISYRRQGGDSTAKIICDRLKDRGHNVFYDVEALRSGAFNTRLYSVIDECSDVIVVLSPESLERCSNEDDWVRLEIAHALKAGKNVIPVFLRGFSFPDTLPEDIGALRYQNGLEANSEFFDAFMERLQSFLKTKPALFRRVVQNTVFKRTLPLTLAILAVLVIILGVSAFINSRANIFPRTQADKNITSEALGYIEQNLSAVDGALREVSDAFAACDNYLVDANPVQYEKAMEQIDHAYGELDGLDFTRYALSENVSSKIDSTPINKGDLVWVNGNNSTLQKSYLQSLLFIKQVVDKKSPIDIPTKRNILKIYKEMLNSDMLNIAYGINELLLPIDSEYLTDFRQKFLPSLVDLPFGTQTWLTEKKELERLMDSVYNQQLQQINNLSSVVGSENFELMTQKAEFEKYALEKGLSQSDIDVFFAMVENNSASIQELRQQLDEDIAKLAEMKNSAREKFAPKEDDKPEILWGKMLRFNTLKLYDDAVKCLQMYQLKVQSDYPDANVYVPAVISFLKQVSSTGVDYGVVVCGYEPGKPKHSVYEIGDIIIAVNDQICVNYNDYTSLIPAGQSFKVTLLRPDAEGRLVFTDAEVPAGQPKIQLLELSESE